MKEEAWRRNGSSGNNQQMGGESGAAVPEKAQQALIWAIPMVSSPGAEEHQGNGKRKTIRESMYLNTSAEEGNEITLSAGARFGQQLYTAKQTERL